MMTDTIKWIEINWKVLDTINDNRSIIGSTEVYYPRRKAGFLLLAKTDKISAKIYNNGKGDAFHHRNS